MNQFQSFGRKIAFEHFPGLNVDYTDVFSVDRVYMRQIVLTLLKIHLDYDTIEPLKSPT